MTAPSRFILQWLVILCCASGAWSAESAKEPAKQFLGLLRLEEKYHPEAAWTKEAGEAVQRHFVRLQELARARKVIFAGRTLEPNPRTIGLVVFEAVDLKEAEAFMAADPAVVAGVMTAEVRPYQIAVARK
jgi:uncharacterized protein YciI